MDENIIQFGSGRFIRGFFDWMVDCLNKNQFFDGKVVVVQSTDSGTAEVLKKQGFKYTVLTQGTAGGMPEDKIHTVDCIKNAINARENWEEVLKYASSPYLQYGVSNTTEVGIIFDEKDSMEIHETFPGKLTAFLYRRYQVFGGAPSKGLIFFPCELIENNGDTLKNYVLRYAESWKLEDNFKSWVESSCIFLNNLVDAITTSPTEGEAAALAERLGYRDECVVIREDYYLWAIEDKIPLFDHIPFDAMNLNVKLVSSIEEVRKKKVRILNGMHTIMVAAAMPLGILTVKDAIESELIRKYLDYTCFNEILPSIGGNQEELKAYAGTIFNRFENPFIVHQLKHISMNTTMKFRVRVLPSIIEYCELMGKVPEGLIFALSCFLYLFKDHELEDSSTGKDFFKGLWMKHFGNGLTIEALVVEALTWIGFWEYDFVRNKELTQLTTAYLKDILAVGLRQALKNFLQQH